MQSFLRDGVRFHRIGIEERVRFFIADGIRREAPGMEVTGAVAVTAGCRMFKSAAEIALMQRANDVTIAAYRAGLTTLREGMPQNELADNIVAAFHALGYDGDVSRGRCARNSRRDAIPNMRQTGRSDNRCT